MGAKFGERINAELKFRIVGNSGPVAQLLHPLWVARDDISLMGNTLAAINEELSTMPDLRVVISGGGFVEIYIDEHCGTGTWRNEASLEWLANIVRERITPVTEILKDSSQEYVLGVDVFDGSGIGGGQFAAIIGNGIVKAVAWKSYPVLDEHNWLAGFGTAKGRQSPRIISTSFGTAIAMMLKPTITGTGR